MSSHVAARPTDRLAVARSLREIGRLLSARGENPYRARAYERGAIALETLRGDFEALVREDALESMPGIGPALAGEITSLHRTGSSPLLERLRAEPPPGSAEPARPVRDRRRPLLVHEARAEAEPLLEHLRAQPAVRRAEPAGGLRRAVETLQSLELVAATEQPDEVLEALVAWPRTQRVLERGPDHATVELARGAPLRLQLFDPGAFDLGWFRLTGSPEHVSRVLAIPAEGLQVSGEEGIYLSRGLPFVPPELREHEGEIEAALDGTLPADLVEPENLQGFVHCHTRNSDGRASVEQMARAAEALGASYITITDHSPAAYYARGLSLDRLRRQWDEIAQAQEKVGIRILRGTECDILADGALDYPDAVLEQLDLVIASIHARHSQDAQQMTARITRAVRHPLFKLWGHGLGRLIGRRPPVACDVPAILDAVAESRAAIEINGDPHRLDLEPRWLREARARRIRFVISTDAHSVGELWNARYGVSAARRGWVRRGEVLNALGVEHFLAAVRPAGGTA